MARESLIRPDPAGLACARGRFWIDPWRPVPLAVLTHAHADHARAGSARYFAAAPGVSLLRQRLGPEADVVGVPYGERVRLGDVDVSFHPAGHVLGSAQVRIDDGDSVQVVTGDFKREPDPTCAPFEVVPCDVLVTEATFGLPVYRWRPTGEVVTQVREWWRDAAARGECAVLFCYALGKAQRLLAELARLGVDDTVWVHGAHAPLIAHYRDAGVHMPPTRPVGEAEKGHDWRGALVLAPPSTARSRWLSRFQPRTTGFASGWMRVRGDRRRRNVDRGFVLSDHADWPGLLRTVEECGARRVFTTHGQADVLARYLKENGIEAGVFATAFEGEDGES